jgi:hypothetical protein
MVVAALRPISITKTRKDENTKENKCLCRPLIGPDAFRAFSLSCFRDGIFNSGKWQEMSVLLVPRQVLNPFPDPRDLRLVARVIQSAIIAFELFRRYPFA